MDGSVVRDVGVVLHVLKIALTCAQTQHVLVTLTIVVKQPLLPAMNLADFLNVVRNIVFLNLGLPVALYKACG